MQQPAPSSSGMYGYKCNELLFVLIAVVVQKCRPKVCPFRNELGCNVVSACMDAGVIAKYKKAVSELSDL
jgi:putative ribosome biogenesis GTPase RsgA